MARSTNDHVRGPIPLTGLKKWQHKQTANREKHDLGIAAHLTKACREQKVGFK